MIVERFEDRYSWLEARRGSITGSRAHSVLEKKRGEGYKIGVYELIAEKLGLSADDEDERERGHRLEPEALERLSKETGYKFDTSLVIWRREEDPDIALSPDGFTEDLKVAAEVKCLSSAKHLKALIEQKLPEPEYETQAVQYFAVNSKLEKLLFGFYDPRVYAKEFFFITITREQLLTQIETLLTQEVATLAYVREKVNELSF